MQFLLDRQQYRLDCSSPFPAGQCALDLVSVDNSDLHQQDHLLFEQHFCEFFLEQQICLDIIRNSVPIPSAEIQISHCLLDSVHFLEFLHP